MGEEQGQGYVGQALGAADMLAAIYANRLRYRADDPHWDGRDRFLLSTGHYAIGLYAALAEAGIVPARRARHLRLRRLPAADVGHGHLHPRHGDLRRLARPRTPRRGRPGARPAAPRLELAGLQLPLRRRAQRRLDLGGRDGCGPPPARQPDRAGRHQRPAGRRSDRRRAVHRTHPRQVGRVRLARPTRRRQRRRRRGRRPRRRPTPAAAPHGQPSVVLCDTKIGYGVPLLENREKAHFMRIDEARMADLPRPAELSAHRKDPNR